MMYRPAVFVARLVAIGLVVSGLWSSVASAAPSDAIEDLKLALALPLEARLKALNLEEAHSIGTFKKVIFDKNELLEVRWRAVTAFGRLKPLEARPVLETCLQSSEWYLRNAAVLVLPYQEREWALMKARGLLQDSAVVVRSSAVDVLAHLGAVEAEEDLWKSLNAKENFKKGQSLWVRKKIAQTLEKFVQKKSEPRLRLLLSDDDRSVQAVAVNALNKIYGRSLSASEWITTAQTPDQDRAQE
jgi:HEAT repeat protein